MKRVAGAWYLESPLARAGGWAIDARTAATADTECINFQKKFWSRTPSAAETAACVTFATSAVNNDANARRRWAYACASVLTSTGFLAQ